MTDTENEILAWHFLPEDRRLYGNGRVPEHERTLVEEGQTLIIDPPIELCKRGLHASVNPLDALKYAPGPICCRVRMHGRVVEGNDKLVATHRTVLAMKDVSDLLHLFACDIAEEAIKKHVEEPDERSLRAIEVKRLWVTGEVTDDELEAARTAVCAKAWDAVWIVAGYAAWYAARDTAWAAANAAAWTAAWDAAEAAARTAAWDADSIAAGIAARTAADQDLEDLLLDAFGETVHT